MNKNIIIENLKLSYIELGEGDTLLVFLHGWGAKKENFINSINLLKDKYKCIAIDLPGFGESDKLKKSFCVDEYVDIVIKFINKILEENNILNKNVILVGHSFGGRLIIKINNIKNLQFNIIKNIFIDSAGIKHKKNIYNKVKISTYKSMKNIINILPIDEKIKQEKLDLLKSKFGSADYKNADATMRETLVKTVNEDLTDLLKNVTKESLLIWGENDKDTPIEDAKIFEKEIKNSGLVILKNCGHFSFVEDQYTYLKVLESFLL